MQIFTGVLGLVLATWGLSGSGYLSCSTGVMGYTALWEWLFVDGVTKLSFVFSKKKKAQKFFSLIR